MADPEHLSAYLDAARAQGFAWGKRDCLTFAADWVLIKTGIDPAAPWRATVANADDAIRLLRARGGMRRHVEDAMAGLAHTDEALRGDVGLVRVPARTRAGGTAKRLVGAIMFGDRRWAILTGDLGLLITRSVEPVAAWSISHG